MMDTDETASASLQCHHFLSDSPKNTINLAQYIFQCQSDPAFKVCAKHPNLSCMSPSPCLHVSYFQDFVPRLKDHLLSWLLNNKYDGDEQEFTSEERNTVHFVNNLNWVVQPKHFQINYTTYDIRHEQDMLHPGHGAFIMMLSREHGSGAHPFWYTQVLCALLIPVNHCGMSKMMEVLWVRWFVVVPGHQWGIKKAHLPKIEFIPDSSGAFGFLDPSLVLRACHLIPAFAEGRTDSLLPHGPSIAREDGSLDDWTVYYVNM